MDAGVGFKPTPTRFKAEGPIVSLSRKIVGSRWPVIPRQGPLHGSRARCSLAPHMGNPRIVAAVTAYGDGGRIQTAVERVAAASLLTRPLRHMVDPKGLEPLSLSVQSWDVPVSTRGP